MGLSRCLVQAPLPPDDGLCRASPRFATSRSLPPIRHASQVFPPPTWVVVRAHRTTTVRNRGNRRADLQIGTTWHTARSGRAGVRRSVGSFKMVPQLSPHFAHTQLSFLAPPALYCGA